MLASQEPARIIKSNFAEYRQLFLSPIIFESCFDRTLRTHSRKRGSLSVSPIAGSISTSKTRLTLPTTIVEPATAAAKAALAPSLSAVVVEGIMTERRCQQVLRLLREEKRMCMGQQVFSYCTETGRGEKDRSMTEAGQNLQ